MFAKFHWICSESFWDIEKPMGSEIIETVGINTRTDVTFHDYSNCIQQNKELVQWSFTGSGAKFFS